jgi:ergothioneine biosynthesis protein EgtB
MQSNFVLEGPLDSLVQQFLNSRTYSTDLVKDLSPEDCQAQSMDETSPTKWHLAHVTWFYEVMVLKQHEVDFCYWNSQYAILFNSYYNIIGDKHPRPKRGLLTRPVLKEVLEWRKNIDQRVVTLLKNNPSDEIKWLIKLGINHEQQHQELILTDLQHLFSCNSLNPSFGKAGKAPPQFAKNSIWISYGSGLQSVGTSSSGFHFDNEGPEHKVYLQDCYLSSTLVSNNEWLVFMNDGGYQNSNWWLDEGWAWVQQEGVKNPLYWHKNTEKNTFLQFALEGSLPLNPHSAVRNISYFEADAYARWASENLPNSKGARLPTEFEWEVFASNKPSLFEDLFDAVWQWTSSSYSPYPGYRAWSGLAGEYNGKFMINQMVLKGSSAFTSPKHSRNTYRNFFPTQARWQMTGLRLAKDFC